MLRKACFSLVNGLLLALARVLEPATKQEKPDEQQEILERWAIGQSKERFGSPAFVDQLLLLGTAKLKAPSLAVLRFRCRHVVFR